MARELSPVEKAMRHLVAENPIFETEERAIDGVDYTLFKYLPSSLRELFGVAHARNAASDFLVYGDERLSYAETYRRAATLAHRLVNELGLEKGDRVAIAARNLPEWIIAFMGILGAGCVAVPVNSWLRGAELGQLIGQAAPKLIFADQRRAGWLEEVGVGGNTRIIQMRGDAGQQAHSGWDELIGDIDQTNFPDVPIGQEDIATIFFTSGSTDRPKGVVSTHRALLSAVFGWTLIAAGIREAEGEPGRQLANLIMVPLFHATGCLSTFLLALTLGRKLVFTNKWEANEALRLIEAENITHLTGVPTMALDLMQSPDLANYDTSSLMDIGGGGAARPPHQVQQIIDTWPQVKPVIGYGLTETNALATIFGRDAYLENPKSVGPGVWPTVELRVVDDDGVDCSLATPGEILIKSPSNFSGYLDDPIATSNALRDGWLYTGDIGYLNEDGLLYIVDRKKDMIIRGGENIGCQEVEAAIDKHAHVAEVAVFGLPDERLGERVAALIYLRPDKELSGDQLTSYLSGAIADFKIPDVVHFSPRPLPRLATGKLDKGAIRKSYAG